MEYLIGIGVFMSSVSVMMLGYVMFKSWQFEREERERGVNYQCKKDV